MSKINDFINTDKLYNKNLIWSNLLKTISIMILSLLISLFFKKIGFNESNIILILTIGVLFVSTFTYRYIYGVIASVLAVLSFNFFFIKPYYTFLISDTEYLITFLIMLIATLITSTLASRLKEEAIISAIKEKRIKLLYINNKKLLKSKSKLDIARHCKDSLVDIFNKDVLIVIKDGLSKTIEFNHYSNSIVESIYNSSLEKESLEKCFSIGTPLGATTQIDSTRKIYYHPIKGKQSILGVIGIFSEDKSPISENEKVILESISTQVALAIEKEDLYEQNKKSLLETHKEKLRSNLLRSISHDLRTPLASILGSTSTLIDNYEKLDDTIKKELLNNIYDDTDWLTRSVENILSMTRIDEGEFKIKKNMEIAEEIVADAVKRLSRFKENKTINVKLPKDIIIIYVDALLIKQVLVNLIDNAIRYTDENSKIEISVEKNKNNVIFKVCDNGKGIKESNINNIFEKFYTTSDNKNIEKRGIGLGLSICKSIVLAHGGEIKAYNNKYKGATFEFSIPSEEKRDLNVIKTTNTNCRG